MNFDNLGDKMPDSHIRSSIHHIIYNTCPNVSSINLLTYFLGRELRGRTRLRRGGGILRCLNDPD